LSIPFSITSRHTFDTTDGFTQASKVIAVVRRSARVSAINVTRAFVPLNTNALPNLPSVVHTAETSWAVFAPPDASAVVVPTFSSNAKAATSPAVEGALGSSGAAAEIHAVVSADASAAAITRALRWRFTLAVGRSLVGTPVPLWIAWNLRSRTRRVPRYVRRGWAVAGAAYFSPLITYSSLRVLLYP